MFKYGSLEGIDTEVLHKAFVDAFSDYQVKIDVPLWKLRNMLQRRGYIPQKSIGAFRDDVLVGFTLNGFRDWKGKPTVYDVGTGVVPEYRKQGLTTNIFKNILELLKAEGVEQYLLEVIQENTAAYELYKKKGFKVTRTFSCYRLDKSKYQAQNNFEVLQVNSFSTTMWEQLKEFWDFQPSWQNSIESICSLSEEFIYSVVRYDNRIVGYGVIEKRTGDIPQIGVDRNYRGKGIARSIMTDLINSTESSMVGVINVDDNSKLLKDFLSTAGFVRGVSQYEMIMDLK